MFTRWTQHLKSDEEKKRFRNDILSARTVLERLKQMLEEDEAALEKSERDQRVYGMPNWDYLQAHKNGNMQVYAVVKKLIDLDQQKAEYNE
jgi:hypothetical protein